MNPLCSYCELIDDFHFDEWRTIHRGGTFNVVGWEQKTEASYKRRSYYNYRKVFRRDKYQCQYCGYHVNLDDFIPLHIDHINPYIHGGGNSMNNLVVACRDCNLMASNKVFKNFMYKKDYIIDLRILRKMPVYDRELCPFPWLIEEHKNVYNW